MIKRNKKGQFVKGSNGGHGFKKGQATQTTHGMCRTKFYGVWRALLARCNNKNVRNYSIYGGKGIKCLWESFDEFKNDMHKSYLEHINKNEERQTTIDRIDSNDHYCKENCRWATYKEQARNTGTNNLITFKGQTLCLAEWSEKLNINYGTLKSRLTLYKWSIEKTFTTPARYRSN